MLSLHITVDLNIIDYYEKRNKFTHVMMCKHALDKNLMIQIVLAYLFFVVVAFIYVIAYAPLV